MNERIRELIERATEPPVFPANIGYFNREKFAELLIRECVLHLHRRGVEGFDILEERNLKEHFGVKE